MKDKPKLWLWFLVACLVSILAGLVRAQEPQGAQCYPAEVNWKLDQAQVRSFGCVMARNDSLFIISHFVNGEPKNVAIVEKQNVISIILYVPKQALRPGSRA